MVSWTISEGVRVNQLSGPWPMLLYTWLIPHADNLGRFHGEPGQVRSLVLPRRRDVTDDMVESWLTELSESGLIHWYSVDGMKYLAFPDQDWSRHQKLRGNMRHTSDLPPPQDDVYTACERRANGVSPEVEGEVEGKGEREVEVEVEGEGEGLRATTGTDGQRRPSNVNTVRTRTGKPNSRDPGPAFWNSPEVSAKIDRLVACGSSHADARSLVLATARAEGLIH